MLMLPVFLLDKKPGNFRKGIYVESGILQQDQKDKGIGPIKNIELGAIDPKMVSKGKDLFNNKCLVCHELDQKKIGPPLRNITKTRSPEYIMNLLLNTVQMQQQDPIVKDLISTYKINMTPPEFSNDQARSVLEYLRSVAK
jgi:cytochrome c551/c552